MQKKSGRNPADQYIPAEAPVVNTSLDPQDWGKFREQAHRMLDDMLGYTEAIRQQPVWQVIPDQVRDRFRQDLPAAPTALTDVHEEFMSSILPYTARNGHPGFMGWVQGGGTPVGMLAEMLAAGLNANVGGRDQIPLDVERQITQWMRTLFGFPAEATGLFVTGTSMANFLAVVIARDAKLGGDVRRLGVTQKTQKLTAYASMSAHGCIARALDLAGLGSDALRLVPMDGRHRIDLAALENIIAADRAAGFTPFLVVGTAGTVDTGAIDDLSAIAGLCAQQQLWFHVDGAYGALAMLAPELAPRLNGIEKADSLAFDFHKWAQVPYDAGFLLVRDGELHRTAFASHSAYLSREEKGMAAGSPWPCDLGLDLSRSFRALKTWATLKVYGTDAIGAVISRTCELARYLEGRISATPELELMAPVELNIVCFRYRFKAAADVAEDLLNHLHRQIVIALHEAGAVAPSTTRIGNSVVIRAAIVNHRTTRAEIDTLVEAVLAAGRSLQPVQSVESKKQSGLTRDTRVQQIAAQLDAEGSLPREIEVAMRFERATLLAQLGRNLEARSDFLKVAELDPSHRLNLIGLGRLFVATNNLKAAQMVYAEAVKRHPDDLSCRVSLGSVLLETEDNEGARVQYQAALEIDPESPRAHAGLYYALSRLGEQQAAEIHQRKSFATQNLFLNPYRGEGKPVSVLLLVSSNGGNIPIEKLLDNRIFETYVVVADFYDTRVPLPKHQLVINGIGEVDVAEKALVAAQALLPFTSAPVLNAPAAVQATRRTENAVRLGRLPGVITPAIASFPHQLLAGPHGLAVLAEHGFTFPLLLRAPGFHMGKHFVRVDSPADLADAVAGLPVGELLAIEYLDACGPDGWTRKYRVMMIDGQLYPLHVCMSHHWKIHYFSAEMGDHPELREEEAVFLADMSGVLGPRAMAALESIRVELGLDYAGVDFGLGPKGEVLLFEANATMIVQQPEEREHWNYRRPAVERIHAAVRRMFLAKAVAVQQNADIATAASLVAVPQR